MNYILIISLLSISGIAFGMDKQQIVILPSKGLYNKFKEAGLEDFAQNTDLIKRLAGKCVNIDGASLAIKTEITDYLFVLMKNRVDIKKYQNLETQVRGVVFGRSDI
jgi:hypothetical protein